MKTFEEEVLNLANALGRVKSSLKVRASRHEMSKQSLAEATQRAEANFVKAVAALRQKEGVSDGEQLGLE